MFEDFRKTPASVVSRDEVKLGLVEVEGTSSMSSPVKEKLNYDDI